MRLVTDDGDDLCVALRAQPSRDCGRRTFRSECWHRVYNDLPVFLRDDCRGLRGAHERARGEHADRLHLAPKPFRHARHDLSTVLRERTLGVRPPRFRERLLVFSDRVSDHEKVHRLHHDSFDE